MSNSHVPDDLREIDWRDQSLSTFKQWLFLDSSRSSEGLRERNFDQGQTRARGTTLFSDWLDLWWRQLHLINIFTSPGKPLVDLD